VKNDVYETSVATVKAFRDRQSNDNKHHTNLRYPKTVYLSIIVRIE